MNFPLNANTKPSMSLKIDELLQKFATFEPHPYTPSSSSALPNPTANATATPSNPHRMKLEVPRFNGSDLLD